MQDAIILGGGISGLTAAYLLSQRGLEVTALERLPRPGGPISSFRDSGYLVERGPNSLLLPDPWAETFLRDLGLADEWQETSPQASKRYIVKGGRPVAVPSSPLQAVFTPLFSLKAKLGFLGEPFRRQLKPPQVDRESVASFVSRRMGSEFLDYAIDPFVSGVYAGDPHELVLKHAFPIMYRFEQDGGSIIRGAMQYQKRRKREGAAYKKRSISFRSGLGILPQTLARKLGNRLWLNAQATSIRHREDTWRVTWKRDGETFEGQSRQLLVCLPAHATRCLDWDEPIQSKLADAPELVYPAVHSLALGFKRSQIDHPLDGFGLLVPSREPQEILGALFSSSLYPNRAPEGKCLLTVMLGGQRHPELADKCQDELTEIALRDLRPLLGIKGNPEFARLTSWPKAIPQYNEDFGPWSNTLGQLQETYPKLHFGGHAIDGIALGACLLSGKRLAETAISKLDPPT